MENYEAVMHKLKILSDAAKYDVSCSSSGSERRGQDGHIGSAAAMGICHTWTSDGRCVSLLKILYSNRCSYDCAYCVSRRSADVERAAFTPRELCDLTMEFYRRNGSAGLFLSSAVDGSPDATAEQICEALRMLREDRGFLGYIHAKIIPGVSPELVHRIGMLADRLSVNIELPTRESLQRLAPQKSAQGILQPMRQITETLADQKLLVGAGNKYSKYRGRGEALPGSALTGPDGSAAEAPGPLDPSRGGPRLSTADILFHGAGKGLTLRQIDAKMAVRKDRFAPAGQTTQLMVGASGDSDLQILALSHAMYSRFFMKRVYFSAYIPLVSSPLLPAQGSEVPLVREHRLYQADWLMRFYGFTADELVDAAHPDLDLQLDPKISWALRHRELFPVEINRAPAEMLLRIPGVGTLSVQRILRQRRYAALRYDDLKRIGVVLKRAKYFITVGGRYYGRGVPEEQLRDHLLMQGGGVQIGMFEGGKLPG